MANDLTGPSGGTKSPSGLLGLGGSTSWSSILDAGSGVFQGIGSAASSLLSAEGAGQEASAYEKAAALAGQDATLEVTATRIRNAAQQRQLLKTIGSEEAEVGKAGFASGGAGPGFGGFAGSGSAFDIMHEAAQQGALASALIQTQGKITENGYLAEQTADLAKAKAAKQAEGGGLMGSLGGVFKAGLAVAGLF